MTETTPMTETTFLVAITVEGPAITRAQAEVYLHGVLPRPGVGPRSGARVQEWWIAEDDRRDGSDNDSAVFVPFGTQHAAGRIP